ncbi:hypothetical protein V2J09_017601 [Rumex salicifolius]
MQKRNQQLLQQIIQRDDNNIKNISDDDELKRCFSAATMLPSDQGLLCLTADQNGGGCRVLKDKLVNCEAEIADSNGKAREVLLEIEEKASVILDERAQHERMANAYTMLNEALHQWLSEQAKNKKCHLQY